MRKPAPSSWKRLNDRMDRVAAQAAEPRMVGFIVRTPRLCDGTVELRINGYTFFMTSTQIDRISELFPDEVDGPENDLPVTEGRMPMSETDFVAYLDFQQRTHAQRSVTYPNTEVDR